MITGILLAAGAGRRFGGAKLLHRLEGTELGLISLRRLQAAVDDVVAVVRPGDATLAQLLEAAGARVVICERANGGMGHSLASAVGAADQASGWIVALGDMPSLHSETIRKVREALLDSERIVVPHYAGQRGHPVGFPGRYRAELLALEGDQGARDLLRREASTLLSLEVDDPGSLLDVDEAADLARHPRQVSG